QFFHPLIHFFSPVFQNSIFFPDKIIVSYLFPERHYISLNYKKGLHIFSVGYILFENNAKNLR
ncbi:MAG: hypothetical protein IJN89_00190, partial [Anaerotignum sp.]|nr:hypothetical protein [Anaerotignum sp.]